MGCTLSRGQWSVVRTVRRSNSCFLCMSPVCGPPLPSRSDAEDPGSDTGRDTGKDPPTSLCPSFSDGLSYTRELLRGKGLRGMTVKGSRSGLG